MKKVKLDHRQSDHRNNNHRGKQQLQQQQPTQQRPMIGCFKTMLKLENITILVLIVLAHQIHGIHSQGKTHNTAFISFIHLEMHANCFAKVQIYVIVVEVLFLFGWKYVNGSHCNVRLCGCVCVCVIFGIKHFRLHFTNLNKF